MNRCEDFYRSEESSIQVEKGKAMLAIIVKQIYALNSKKRHENLCYVGDRINYRITIQRPNINDFER